MTQVTSIGLFEVMDALMEIGRAVGTAVDREDWVAGDSASSKKMCLYTRRLGESQKSYPELVKGLQGCFCGKCLDCLYDEHQHIAGSPQGA